jgi:hypothetical protein
MAYTVRTNGVDFTRPNACLDTDTAFDFVDEVERIVARLGEPVPLIEVVEEDGTVFWSNGNENTGGFLDG